MGSLVTCIRVCGAVLLGGCAPSSRPDSAPAPVRVEGSPNPAESAGADAGLSSAPPPPRAIGPFTLPVSTSRAVYFAVPPVPGSHRLIANLHGLCNPPAYACGTWAGAASERGLLICPEGNARCGGAAGPPSWDESFAQMDLDLEKAVATVEAAYPGEVSREGAVLTGFSRGAWAAPAIAAMHKGRWPYLVLVEADVTLTRASLDAAGVRGVVLIAGEYGTEAAGERQTVLRLKKEGVHADFILMPKVGHYYASNIDELMGAALDFLVGGSS